MRRGCRRCGCGEMEGEGEWEDFLGGGCWGVTCDSGFFGMCVIGCFRTLKSSMMSGRDFADAFISGNAFIGRHF